MIHDYKEVRARIQARAETLVPVVELAQREDRGRKDAGEVLIHATPEECELRVLISYLEWDAALPLLRVVDPDMTEEDIANIGPDCRLPWEADDLDDASIIGRLDDVATFAWQRAESAQNRAELWKRVEQGLARIAGFLLVSNRVELAQTMCNEEHTQIERLIKLNEAFLWPIPDWAKENR